MDPLSTAHLSLTRRELFGRVGAGVGLAALATLLGDQANEARAQPPLATATGGLPGLPHFAPKANRVIYLTQSGAPSQVDLFDYKPLLQKFRGQELPDSVRMGQRLTTMTAGQKLTIQPSHFKFAQHGRN